MKIRMDSPLYWRGERKGANGFFWREIGLYNTVFFDFRYIISMQEAFGQKKT